MLKNNTLSMVYMISLLLTTSSCNQIKKYEIEKEYDLKNISLSSYYDQKIKDLQLKCEYYKSQSDAGSAVESSLCEQKSLELQIEFIDNYKKLREWRRKKLVEAGIDESE